jgi:hypothetical protein
VSSEPIFKESPRFCLFTDFLPANEWSEVKKYCELNEEKFEFVGHNPIVGWKKQTHSSRSEISFQTSFLPTPDEIDAGQYFTNGDNYKISMHIPADEKVNKILLWMLIRARDTIKKTYGNTTYFESGPWLSMAKKGDHMGLHCDGVFLDRVGAVTDFSCVYYVNDNYEGGEIYMPIIGMTIKPKANSLLIWSHTWHEDMAHGVKPVTSGTRYMSQGFFTTV